MTQPLTEDEKAIRRYERAAQTAQTALGQIVQIHAEGMETGGGLKYCSLCFKNWPCETHRTADTALAKMKGQLPQ